MAGKRPSRQDLARSRRQREFFGREQELGEFRAALSAAPDGELDRFLFHIHGAPAVGKTSLSGRMEDLAWESGALVATVDDAVNSAVEAMDVISRQFKDQKAPFKSFDKRLAEYRKRQDGLLSGASGPSTGAVLGAKVGLSAADLLGGHPFVKDLNASDVAEGAERLWTAASDRRHRRRSAWFGRDPVGDLTSAFLQDLGKVADQVASIALFFDAYERTRAVLDGWLRDVCLRPKYGEFPSNVVLTLAGQEPPNLAVWGHDLSSVREIPLRPLSEDDSRRLLASRGVTEETLVRQILRDSNGLPLRVRMLADSWAGVAGVVTDQNLDPSDGFWFLRGVDDPSLRAAILAAALPQWLDEDVFRATVPPERGNDYAWLTRLALVTIQGSGHVHYHDTVRDPILRELRGQSGRWRDQHERLITYFEARLAEVEQGLRGDQWSDEQWLECHESVAYHALCADAVEQLPQALSVAVSACGAGVENARRWARLLTKAGADADAAACADWGSRLTAALNSDDGVLPALELLLAEAELSSDQRLYAYELCGQHYEQAERYAAALATFGRGLELDSESIELRYGRARIHVLMENHELAIEDLNQVLEREVDAAALSVRGVAFHLSQRYSDALADYTAALELDPGQLGLLIRRAQVYRELGRRAEAIADLTEAVQGSPEDRWAREERAETYYLGNDYAEASADFTELLAQDPANLFAWTRRALCARGLGREDDAVRDLTEAAKLEPGNTWVLIERATSYARLRRHAEAVAGCDEALRLEPENAWAFAVRADNHYRMGQDAQALADYGRAIDLVGTYRWALSQRAVLYRDLLRLDKAMADLDRVLELDPRDALAMAQRGCTHQAAGRPEQALADLDEAVRIAPDNAQVRTIRGEFLLNADRLAAALADLEHACELQPDYAYPLAQRGNLHLTAGRLDQALADLDHALRLDPGYDWARAVRGVALRLQGHLEQCMDELAVATTGFTRIDVHAARAEILRHWKRYAEAREELARSIAKFPRSSFAQLERAVLETVAGDADTAARYWAEAERVIGLDQDLSATGRLSYLLVVACGTGRSGLATVDELLAAGPTWLAVFQAVDWLTALAEAPGADSSVGEARATLARCLRELTP